MATYRIRLLVKTLKGGDRIVVAKDNDGAAKGGNVAANPNDQIWWRRVNDADGTFEVTFFDFYSNACTWPFAESPELTRPCPDDSSVQQKVLLVPSGADTLTKRTWIATAPVKYEVAVKDDASVEPLDPMIIVRDRNVSVDRSLVATLLTAAIGAAVGSLVTFLVLGGG